MPCNLCGTGTIHVCFGPRRGDRVTIGPVWMACGYCGYQGPKADHPPHATEEPMDTYSMEVHYDV